MSKPNTHKNRSTRLPAEFEKQSFVQMIFPHADSDWAPYLQEASETFVAIATAISRFERCLMICDDIVRVKAYFSKTDNISFIQADSDDTWARDCSGITVINDTKPTVIDFTFTGWGNKFDASLDNALTSKIADYYGANYKRERVILEGGAIESNGDDLILTTTECLLNPNRNIKLTQKFEIENILAENLGTKKILWLNHGYLAGDDTDSHIDTLARFSDRETIVYVQCLEKEDEHYEALSLMEEELQLLRDLEGKPFKLLALPMTDAIYYDEERLPATYANFLIINDAVIVPTYSDRHDGEALETIQKAFPTREVIGVECSVLIRQHGSLHCVTMQFPEAVTLKAE
ncbi:MAG: agmatine deiminase family protein [Helicobacteraceae bacterium]|jgi:agmatine deiminase|nr:agmatine deiminase family protein [Helicobacteraceae bacterium]